MNEVRHNGFKAQYTAQDLIPKEKAGFKNSGSQKMFEHLKMQRAKEGIRETTIEVFSSYNKRGS